MYQLGSNVSLQFVSFQHILIQWQNTGEAFAFLHKTYEQMDKGVFPERRFVLENCVLTTGNTESGMFLLQ